MISAEIILDSVSPISPYPRLTTFRLRYPKWIHGEFLTHRVFSRNASSSRAVPTAKLLEEVRNKALRAGPVSWGKNMPGMQAAEELTGDALFQAKAWWAEAAHLAALCAEIMLELGVHKQIVNRILEPFTHINVLVTATEYRNFFGLRLDKGAQPEIRALAEMMWIEYKNGEPRTLEPGQWHLPFVTGDLDLINNLLPPNNSYGLTPHEQMLRISVARCARVSYTSFDTGKRSTVEEDLRLYDRLMGAQPLHASPAEHQATPDVGLRIPEEGGRPTAFDWEHPEQWGNFNGWRQHRKMIKGEACAPLPEGYNP